MSDTSPLGYWSVNGVLIIERSDHEWEPRSWHFKDFDGMSIWLEKSPATGFPILVSAGGKDGALWAWGAEKAGSVGYLSGSQTSYGKSHDMPSFMKRSIYPKGGLRQLTMP